MEFGGNDNGGVHGKIRIPPYLTVDDIIMGPPETLYHLNKSSNAMTEDTELNFYEEDHFMPVANIIRIMRKVLPQNAKISDDAKQAIQESVTAFIGIITGEANDRCQQEQRKSITADDLLWAMKELGFHDYIEPLMVYLSRFRKIVGGKRGSIRGDPQVKRVDRGPKALPGHEPTTFHPMAAPYGYFGAFPVNGFVEDQAGGAGPSHASTVGGEPNPPREE